MIKTKAKPARRYDELEACRARLSARATVTADDNLARDLLTAVAAIDLLLKTEEAAR